jgi:hypothetical protein
LQFEGQLFPCPAAAGDDLQQFLFFALLVLVEGFKFVLLVDLELSRFGEQSGPSDGCLK